MPLVRYHSKIAAIMIKVPIILCLIFATILVHAQVDPLDDFWEKVEQRKKIDNKRNLDYNIEYTKNIFKLYGANLYLVQQQYVYELKSTTYVRGDGGCYGWKFGIGLAIGNILVTSYHLQKPWMNDKSLLPQKGCVPRLTDVKLISLVDTVSQIIPEDKYDLAAKNELLQYSFDEQISLNIEINEPDTIGFLLLFYYDHISDTIQTKTIEYKPEWYNGVSDIDTQWLDEKLIGGVYFNIDAKDASVDFKISGIITGEVPSKYKLLKLGDHLLFMPSDKSTGGGKSKKPFNIENKSSSSGEKKEDIKTRKRQKNDE